ncbi:MAG: hypothetical protein ACI90V_005004 [Bacillariaceae sp.]|jgi:hypothetical protein
MKIWPKRNSNAAGTTASAYSKIQLVESQSVDLFIHSSRGKSRFWSCLSTREQHWLEEGRPRELASLPLATWSLLTTSIKEYQRGLRESSNRVLRRIVLPTYFIWFVCLIISMMYIEGGDVVDGALISSISWYGLIIVLISSVFITKYYTQKHVVEVFHPAVQTVLQELDEKLIESGYDVKLFVQNGSWSFPTPKPTISFLRLTPLRNEDTHADQQDVI